MLAYLKAGASSLSIVLMFFAICSMINATIGVLVGNVTPIRVSAAVLAMISGWTLISGVVSVILRARALRYVAKKLDQLYESRTVAFNQWGQKPDVHSVNPYSFLMQQIHWMAKTHGIHDPTWLKPKQYDILMNNLYSDVVDDAIRYKESFYDTDKYYSALLDKIYDDSFISYTLYRRIVSGYYDIAFP